MLQVQHISFAYDKDEILTAVDFKLKPGEHLSIIGKSGSGKSTLLKLIHGEFDLNEGQIFWKDTEILGPKFNLVIGYDFMKYVAQEFDLMPFISAEENIGKHLSNFFPKEKEKRVQELLDIVELNDFAKTRVQFLSGGQKQRVALARALAKQPEILLLDEPFSHIDNFQKQSLRRNVFNYLKEKHITCIVATHDRQDVLAHADRMIVLHESKIIVNDTPKAVYKNPKTPLIASFFGEYNVIDGAIFYAHQLQVVESSNMKVSVKRSYFEGERYLIEADFDGKPILFVHHASIPENQSVFLKITERK